MHQRKCTHRNAIKTTKGSDIFGEGHSNGDLSAVISFSTWWSSRRRFLLLQIVHFVRLSLFLPSTRPLCNQLEIFSALWSSHWSPSKRTRRQETAKSRDLFEKANLIPPELFLRVFSNKSNKSSAFSSCSKKSFHRLGHDQHQTAAEVNVKFFRLRMRPKVKEPRFDYKIKKLMNDKTLNGSSFNDIG